MRVSSLNLQKKVTFSAASEQSAFLDMQLGINNDLIQELKNNYRRKMGILRNKAYVKLLEDIMS